MNIIGTGLSGLVGSRVVELLSPSHSFENLSLETGVDITDSEAVTEKITGSDAPWVFHFAAKTDVDGSEGERAQGAQSNTWKVNVDATRVIVDACARSSKRLLFVSTDYVFDGKKDTYTEEDVPHPLGWYAVTKYEAEQLVTKLGSRGLIIRIANPYRASDGKGKQDFVHKILELLRKGSTVVTPTDQLLIPTFIDDIAKAIDALIRADASGIYHVVGSQAVSPYQAARAIAREFGVPDSTIQKTTCAQYFSGRAPRPFRAVLKNAKIQKFGVSMCSFDEGLAIIRLAQTEKGVL